MSICENEWTKWFLCKIECIAALLNVRIDKVVIQIAKLNILSRRIAELNVLKIDSQIGWIAKLNVLIQ